MQLQTLTNAIFSIEKMVGSEGQPQQLFVQLHKLSKQVASLIKTHQFTVSQNKECQKERQQLRKKLKKATVRLEKKEQECQQLKSELARTKDMYDHKINKLIRSREEKPYEMQQAKQKLKIVKESKINKSRDIQCQILNESLVKELQERNLSLLRKINKLQKELEEQKNENNSKQLYIESLLTALDDAENQTQIKDDDSEDTQREASCQDINDVSTIDADSLKDEDHQSEFFPQGERKIWHESEFQGGNHCEGWSGSMSNAFKRVKSWFWKM